MRRPKKSSPFWDYLDASGVLEKGSDEEIKAVKRQYRKQYLLRYKRTKRNDSKEYTISIKKESHELSKVTKEAKRHGMPVPTFILNALYAYMERKYIVPNPYQVASLEQLLSECLNEIRSIAQSRDRFFWDAEMKLERIEKKVIQLEKIIEEALRNPTPLPT